MTNKRRSDKGKTAAESPDRAFKKLNRTGRRSKNSESSEKAEDGESDYSGEEQQEEEQQEEEEQDDEQQEDEQQEDEQQEDEQQEDEQPEDEQPEDEQPEDEQQEDEQQEDEQQEDEQHEDEQHEDEQQEEEEQDDEQQEEEDQEDEQNNKLEDWENDSSKNESQFESEKNNEDPKSQIKEESARSDGSWKVKSENGGGGGIPKLKLCLTRSPEMSSHTSTSEQNPSPRRRHRNKNKKKKESDESEVTESSSNEIILSSGVAAETNKSSETLEVPDTTRKENEEPLTVKSGARKRRWGSSTCRGSKKPPVSISTDVLKEIIPEVKPLLMSEVQLSPNEEDEEGQLKDSEENLPMVMKKVDREKILQSDESEKDYEEEAVESGMEEPMQTEVVKPTPQLKEKEFTTFTRKVSVMSSNEKLQKSPSPPRHKPSNILYIVNLVRPFTIPQLRELLARTGTIAEDGFWIDKIKSKCYVKYQTEEEAKTTRHALHGVRWPVSNPKQLNVDFGTEAAMKTAMEGNEITTKRLIPSLFDKQIDLKTNEKTRERERDKSGDKRDRSEKDKKEKIKHRDDNKREEEEDRDKKSRPVVEPLVRDRPIRRVTMPIREWDVGKNEDGFSPPPDGIEFSRHRDDRYDRRVEYDRDKRDDYDERRKREKDRNRRSVSGEPPRKSKKKSEEEAPAKLLDDLFRKTKATPCIYWLPLTPEQISVKEEMRRKHMAEHEKKVAELRKMQREQNKRSSDKRRRRTRSRSRSRSAKK